MYQISFQQRPDCMGKTKALDAHIQILFHNTSPRGNKTLCRTQACCHPHLQPEQGRLHVVCSRSSLISFAFSGLSSSSHATGTGPSSRCLLEIFADQLCVLRLVVILACNQNRAVFTLFARDLLWSALRSQACVPHVCLHVVNGHSD